LLATTLLRSKLKGTTHVADPNYPAPTDFSQQSKLALRLACSLTRDHGARLIILHVASVLLVEENRGVAAATPSSQPASGPDATTSVRTGGCRFVVTPCPD
jgi:hypothetical protein